jgi:SAM-dependent methyltransferase
LTSSINKKIFLARKIVTGLLTYAPFLNQTLFRLRESLTGQSHRKVAVATAPYCYAVWMRHLLQWHAAEPGRFPKTVAEIGPGNSLGVGLAALLSGVSQYYALDAVTQVDFKKNIDILEDLVELFADKTRIPDHEEYPELGPPLQSYAFPDHILPDARLIVSLNANRLDRIRKNLQSVLSQEENDMLTYITPWSGVLPPRILESVDWILSQFVMEHVDDLPVVYEQFYGLLKPGGCMTHHIDFRSHWTSYEWNGYWAYDDRIWRMIRGKRPYFINRMPLSEHLSCIRRAGFEVLHLIKTKCDSGIALKQLARRFSNLSADDLQIMGAMIVASKP